MIDHVWSVLCSNGVIDIETNNVSLHNVIEQISVQGPPEPNARIPIQLDILSFLVRSDPEIPARKDLRISFRFPSGKVDRLGTADINLLQHERFRARARLQGIPANEPGRHYFLIELQGEGEDEWNQVAAIPLTLIYKSKPDSSEEE